MRIPRTSLVGGTSPNMHTSWRQHTMWVGRRGIRFGTLSLPWTAVKSYSITSSAPLVRTFFLRYRELNITVKTNLGTYRFLSVARIPVQTMRGQFERFSGKTT